MQEIGHAALAIIPSFDGFQGKLESGSSKAMAVAGAKGGTAFGKEAGDKATSELGAKLQDWSRKGAVVAGGLIGAAIGYGLKEGIDRERIGDVIAASQGLSARAQQQQGKIAGSLYAKAFGESYEDVAKGVAAAATSLPGLQGNGEIRRASADALNFAQVFEVDVARAVQVAGTLINSGLAKDAESAFDLLTRSSQKVPVQLREDVLDAAEEYGQFFRTLGFDGPKAFELLVKGAEQGMYGIDKTGDALKEFTIRSTDGSKATATAFDQIDLLNKGLEEDLLAGGDAAQSAFQKIIGGLLDMEDPSQRAQAAVALFGTPIEDLNVSKIPAFLRSLQGTKDGLDDVKGSAERMGDTLSDNVSTDITKMKRKLENDLVEFISKKGLPALESFSDWVKDDAGPAFRNFKDDIDPVLDVVQDLAGAFGKLPSEAKIGALAALVGGGAALKLRGGGDGALGTAGKVLGIAKPIPVFVTNPGGIGGAPGGGKTPKSPLASLLFNPATAFIAQAAIGTTYANDKLNDVVGPERASAITTGKTGEGIGAGLFTSDDFAGPKEAARKLAEQQELAAVASEKSRGALRGFWLEGKAADKVMKNFNGTLSATGNYVIAPKVDTSDIERAIAAAQTLNATIRNQADVARGADGGVNYQHGGTGGADPRAGVTNHFHGGIHGSTIPDVIKHAERTSRKAGRGGFQRSP